MPKIRKELSENEMVQKPRTMEELRKQYRKLMKENHPDVGGTEEAAKEINAEYDRLYAILILTSNKK